MHNSGNIYEIKSERYQYDWDHVERHDAVRYTVRSTSELIRYVIPFFEKYPLRGRKRVNFELWKQIVHMVDRKEHLSPQGRQKIRELSRQLNAYRGKKHRKRKGRS